MNSNSTFLSENSDQAPEGMQQFLDQMQSYKTLRRGDIVEGVIMRVDREGVLVNIGAKSEGVIPSREMQSLSPEVIGQMKVGDEVVVYVVHNENEDGQVVLSLDQAEGEKGWHTLQRYLESGESFEAQVTGFNRGGLLVNTEGVNGFVPISHLVGMNSRNDDHQEEENPLSQKVGQEIRLKVIELNRHQNRVILSERLGLREWREQQKERLLGELKRGEIRQGKVTGIHSFGAFVDLGGADGLVPLSELSWEPFSSPEEILKVGDEIEVYIMKVDAEAKRIALSLRRVQPEPWDAVLEKYQEGQLVKGTVTKLALFGAFARLEGSVEGLIHISELTDKPIQHPKEVVKEGDVLTLKILKIEPQRRRLGLSLRQVEEAEGESQE